MYKRLIELLPDEISDETAYHIFEFLNNITLELESYYYCQIMQHRSDLKAKRDTLASLVSISTLCEHEPCELGPIVSKNPRKKNSRKS